MENTKELLDELTESAIQAQKILKKELELSESSRNLVSGDSTSPMSTEGLIHSALMEVTNRLGKLYSNADAYAIAIEAILTENLKVFSGMAEDLKQARENEKAVLQAKEAKVNELEDRVRTLDTHITSMALLGQSIEAPLKELTNVRTYLTSALADRDVTDSSLTLTASKLDFYTDKVADYERRLVALDEEALLDVSLSKEEQDQLKKENTPIFDRDKEAEIIYLRNEKERLTQMENALLLNPAELKVEIESLIRTNASQAEIDEKASQLLSIVSPLEEVKNDKKAERDKLNSRITESHFTEYNDPCFSSALASSHTMQEKAFTDVIVPNYTEMVESQAKLMETYSNVLDPLSAAITVFQQGLSGFENDKAELENEIVMAMNANNTSKANRLQRELSRVNEDILVRKTKIANYQNELTQTQQNLDTLKSSRQATIAKQIQLTGIKNNLKESLANPNNYTKEDLRKADAQQAESLNGEISQIEAILNPFGKSLAENKDDLLRRAQTVTPPVANTDSTHNFDEVPTDLENPSKITSTELGNPELIKKGTHVYNSHKGSIAASIALAGVAIVTTATLLSGTPRTATDTKQPLDFNEVKHSSSFSGEKNPSPEPEEQNAAANLERPLAIGDKIISFDGDNTAFLTALDAVHGTNGTSFDSRYVSPENNSHVTAFKVPGGERTSGATMDVETFANKNNADPKDVVALIGVSNSNQDSQGWTTVAEAEEAVGKGARK